MEEELPYAGNMCDDKGCRLWWLATIGGKTYEAEVEIPDYRDVAPTPHQADIHLEDIFKDSVLRLSVPDEKLKEVI
jgi:hypothetical protein